jgi:hypothetical protein
MPTIENPFPYYEKPQPEAPDPQKVARDFVWSIGDVENATPEEVEKIKSLKSDPEMWPHVKDAIKDRVIEKKTGRTPLYRMDYQPDEAPMTMEKGLRMAQEGLTYGLGSVAPQLKPVMSGAERKELEYTRNANPVASTSIDIGSGLANPTFTTISVGSGGAVNPVTARAGAEEAAVIVPKLLQMAGPVGDAARMAGRWGRGAAEMFATSVLDGKRWDEALDDARKMIYNEGPGVIPVMESVVGGVVKPGLKIAGKALDREANIPGPDLGVRGGTRGKATTGEAFGKKLLTSESSDLNRFLYENADDIKKAQIENKKLTPDLAGFLEPEGAVQSFERERAKDLAPLEEGVSEAERKVQDTEFANTAREKAVEAETKARKSEFESRHAKTMERLGKEHQKKLDKITADGEASIAKAEEEAASGAIGGYEGEVTSPAGDYRKSVGRAYSDSANRLIEESGDAPVNTERMVSFIDSAINSHVGLGKIHTPKYLNYLQRVKNALQGIRENLDFEVGESMSASDYQKMLKGESLVAPQKEIPLKDFNEITRQLNFPESGGPGGMSGFERDFYREAVETLKNQKGPGSEVSGRLARLKGAYHDAVSSLDSLSEETLSKKPEDAVRQIAKPTGKARYEAQRNAVLEGASGIESETGVPVSEKIKGPLSALERRKSEYQSRVEGEEGKSNLDIENERARQGRVRTSIEGKGEKVKKGLAVRGVEEMERAKAAGSERMEAAKKRLEDVKERLSNENRRVGSPPVDAKAFVADALSGNVNNLNDKWVTDLEARDPVVKRFMNKARVWAKFRKDTNEFIRDLSLMGVSHFGKYHAAASLTKANVLRSQIYKRKFIQKWMRSADEVGLHNNRSFQRVTGGIWPLAIPARIALPKIIEDGKGEDLAKAIEENIDQIGQESIGGE